MRTRSLIAHRLSQIFLENSIGFENIVDNMAPTWIPLCRSMQLYCEPYFAAINNWRAYKEEAILHNRLRLVETACQIFHAHSNNPVLHKFDIVCHHPEVPLLPEVPPTAGREYKVGGDQLAFETAMRTQPKDLFHRAGVFFQDNLLKAIAGWTAEILSGANVETRATIIAAVEKLLRFSEEAGEARFVYTIENPESYSKKDVVEYPSADLSERGLQFFRYVVETRQPGFSFEAAAEKKTMVEAVDSKKKNSNKRGRSEEEDEWEADAEGVLWTKKHPSIGTQVANYFPQPGSSDGSASTVVGPDASAAEMDAKLGKLFRGKVIKFAPPSAPGLTDQLYHIRWEDGDEQDFDEHDMERGMDLFDRLEGWTTRHHTVGLRVAAYFPVPGATAQKLFCGTVTKFGAPTAEDEVPLFHVVFDDGDEQDFSQQELNLGVELYANEGETVQFESRRSSKKAAVEKPAAKAASPVVKSNARKAVEVSPPEPAPLKAPRKELEAPQKTGKAVPVPTKPIAKEVPKTKASSTSKKATQLVAKVLDQMDGDGEGSDDEPLWTMMHDSVGKRVAQHFLLPGPKNAKPKYEVFGGTVAVYAGPSKPKAKDQLYHIVWDDGDEQDFDERELQAGLKLLEQMMPSPLYLASKDAKELVAKKQQEMAVDASTTTTTTTAAVNGSNGEGQQHDDAATSSGTHSSPARTTTTNGASVGSVQSVASKRSVHSAHGLQSADGGNSNGHLPAVHEDTTAAMAIDLTVDPDNHSNDVGSSSEDRAATPDGNGTDEGSSENAGSDGAESDDWRDDGSEE